ncbi:MAG: hypothetical protein JW751_22025 [Polyangiaceae bacterium]|nr:hypothetical protein [Polyangiaceae bacterium]
MPTPHAPSSVRERSPSIPVLLLLVAALVGVAAPGLAQAPSESSESVVEVMLVGEIGRDPAFSRRVTSWFDAERYRVVVGQAARLDPSSILAPQQDRTVYVWVLLRDLRHARLYFAYASGSGGQTTYLWRDLELAAGLDEVGAENIAQVLYLSTVALLEGQAGNRREEVERMLREEPAAGSGAGSVVEPNAEPVTPPTTPRQPPTDQHEPHREKAQDREPGIGVELGLGYRASLRGDEGIWHGPMVEFGLRAASGWGLGAMVQSALPSSREMGPLTIDFYGALVALAGSYRRAVGPSVGLEWIGGLGVEVVQYRPARSLEPAVSAGTGDTEARPGVVGGMSGVFRRSSPRIVVSGQGLFPLERTHYDIVTGEARREIGRAAPVIPSLGVQARF